MPDLRRFHGERGLGAAVGGRGGATYDVSLPAAPAPRGKSSARMRAQRPQWVLST